VAAKPLETESAANAVKRFEPLLGGLVDSWSSEDAHDEAKIMPLDGLPDEHQFGAALEAILSSARENRLMRYSRRGLAFAYDLGFVEITFFNPLPAVRIEHVRGTQVRKVWAYGINVDRDRYLSAVHGSGLAGPAREARIDQTELDILGKALATNQFDPERPTWPNR
jgi:hypothetical protein